MRTAPTAAPLICATNSETGRALAQSAKNGTLTWEELSAAKWMYAKASSSSDFFYPDLWLSEQFGKTLEICRTCRPWTATARSFPKPLPKRRT